MAFPSVKFVDAPDDSAAVRLDLNGLGEFNAIGSLHDDFSLGMPELDGEAGQRGRRWGKRTLPLPLILKGHRIAARAALTALAREATRDGWLRWQFDSETPPVWFRTYASSPSAASFDLMRYRSYEDQWLTTLDVVAEPFGVGAPVTLGPFTVTNSPLSGTNPMQVTLPAVAGEMPAPALVRVSKAATGGMLGPAAAVLPTPMSTVAAANWTVNVGSAVTSIAYLAGSYRQTAAGVSDWANICSFTPSTSLPVGRRRALLRLSGSASAGAFLLRWVAASPAASTQVTTQAVLVPVAQMLRWVDTGVLPYPIADGAAVGVAPTTVYTLQAKRVATGGELRFDGHLALAGVDDSPMQVASPGDLGTAAAELLFDSEKRVVVAAAGGQLARTPASRGGWPTLTPGRTNVLLLMQNLDPTLVTSRDDSITSTTEVTVTYRPQYLWGIG